jgi:hypothetical protein
LGVPIDHAGVAIDRPAGNIFAFVNGLDLVELGIVSTGMAA